jgi:spore photoproduct lyase
MDKLVQAIDRVFIHTSAKNSSVAERVLNLFPIEKINFVDEAPTRSNRGMLSASEFNKSKRELLITEFPGQFFKQCPGFKPGLVCCNYFVLNLGLQCNMNCSYCYLQSYINTPLMTIYSNIDAAINQMRDLAEKYPDKSFRVGTGETIDSLSLDPITLYSRHLISFFKEFPNWGLELKTKSDHVEQFLDMDHAGNTVVSWSVNPQNIIDSEEHGTASLNARLTAARRCRDKNFQVGFHLDPLIWHPEWEHSYTTLVNEITTRFRPSEVAHVSLGALRFVPEQRAIMRERFGMKSLVTSAEMFPSKDGKLRYDNRLRAQMFEKLLRLFSEDSSEWKVLLCMETPETWLAHLNTNPRHEVKIREFFQPLPKS